jgi:hypothetical protein
MLQALFWAQQVLIRALHWKSMHPVFIGLNRVEMLVLLLPHGRWREFGDGDVQIGPVILVGLH